MQPTATPLSPVQADRRRRVLVFSHNAFSDTRNNGKTLSSIFSGWPREALAQLYLTVEEPSFTVCGNFFRVTDSEVLHAFLRGGKAGGMSIAEQPDAQAQARRAPSAAPSGAEGWAQALLARHWPLPELMRDLLWRGKRYQSEALLAWLDEFSPEVVFFQGSNYPFAFDLVAWICARYGAKLVLQLTDDYTYVPHPWLPISWVNHFRYMRRFKKALAKAEAVYAIGPAMQQEYARRFGCEGISVAANCVVLPDYVAEAGGRGGVEGNPLRLLYAGSVHTGRWRMLLQLAESLNQLRAEGHYARLEVYTPSALSPELVQKLHAEPSMAYCGTLSASELKQAMTEANVLVLVEAVSRAARKVTRLSLSTKIPEYMAAGRCILAAGPQDVSSIRYIREQDAGIVVDGSDAKDMLRGLREAFDDERRFAMVQKALCVAQAHHDRDALQREVYASLQGK